MSADPETRDQDANRRLESLCRIGTVAEVDYAAAKCRVQSGGLLTDWLPWLERRMGDTRDWDPPFIGEQAIILSPSGETASGVVLTGIPSDANPPPIHDKNKYHRRWPDDAFCEYDHAAHRYVLDVPAGGEIVLHIGRTTLTLTDAETTLKTPRFRWFQTEESDGL
ncbi:MAG: phage baseplate assembly protein V [Betaproteobacteria bacterium]|nr:phage baseplate assembly protein V [Betaproteobacteria bacterium]